MKITPDLNAGKNIFCFPSNERGVHEAGAALEARKHWGAIYGVGVGPQGHAYAIPTKDWEIKTLPLPVIAFYVSRFLVYARLHPEKRFLVCAIGIGLAGLQPSQVAPMFHGHPSNCVMPDEFAPFLS